MSARLLSVGEAARYLKVHPRTVRDWITRGKLVAKRVGRFYVVPLEEVGKIMTPKKTVDDLLMDPEERKRQAAKFRALLRGRKPIDKDAIRAEWGAALLVEIGGHQLTMPLIVSVERRAGFYEIQHQEFGIFGRGRTQTEAVGDFLDYLLADYRAYAEEPDENLDKHALELSKRYRRLFGKRKLRWLRYAQIPAYLPRQKVVYLGVSRNGGRLLGRLVVKDAVLCAFPEQLAAVLAKMGNETPTFHAARSTRAKVSSVASALPEMSLRASSRLASRNI